MVYGVSNRIIYRGFHSDMSCRQKIIRANGKEAKGRWITGYLTEVPMDYGEKSALPILCLDEPGKRHQSVSSRCVYPDTTSLFSGTFVQTDWTALTKAERASWLKAHTSDAWKGYPVFEGDIFWHRLKKEYYVITFDLPHGFQLKNMATGNCDIGWGFDLLARKGTLWAPPKALSADIVQRYHKLRAAESRVEPLALDA